MPLFALCAAQNSMRSWKSLYEPLDSRKPPLPLSATIAPSSARQFASPTGLKLSIPFSPSISVVQPLPGIHAGIEEQAVSSSAGAIPNERFMASSCGTASVFQNGSTTTELALDQFARGPNG